MYRISIESQIIPDGTSSSAEILPFSGTVYFCQTPLLVKIVSPDGCNLCFTLFQKSWPLEEIVNIDRRKATPTHSAAVNNVKFVILVNI